MFRISGRALDNIFPVLCLLLNVQERGRFSRRETYAETSRNEKLQGLELMESVVFLFDKSYKIRIRNFNIRQKLSLLLFFFVEKNVKFVQLLSTY